MDFFKRVCTLDDTRKRVHDCKGWCRVVDCSERDWGRFFCMLFVFAGFVLVISLSLTQLDEEPAVKWTLFGMACIVTFLLSVVVFWLGHSPHPYTQQPGPLEITESLSNGTQRITRTLNGEPYNLWPKDEEGQPITEDCDRCNLVISEPPVIVTTCASEEKHFFHRGCYDDFQDNDTESGQLRKRKREGVKLSRREERLMNAFKDSCPACQLPIRCYILIQESQPVSARVLPTEGEEGLEVVSLG